MPAARLPVISPRASALARGVVQLGTQATVAVADLVEAMHQAVWTTVGVTGAGSGRTGGVSGLVYRTVRAITGGVGWG